MAKNNSAVPLLALILAIPAVACYVWWTHLNTETRRQLSLRVRGRTEDVHFGAATDRDKLNNPIAATPAGAPASGGGVLQPAAVASSSAAARPILQPAVPSAAAPAPAPAPASGGGGMQPAGAMAAVPAAAPGVAMGAVPAAAGGPAGPVTISRDPMISPFDLVRLQQLEYEREQARLELERGSHPRKRSEASVESRIELEGIVSGQSGNRAIINGDTVVAGDVVLGAKVVRITAQSVVFAYKSRRFIKSISK